MPKLKDDDARAPARPTVSVRPPGKAFEKPFEKPRLEVVPEPQPADPLLGKVINNKYVVREKLGSGGMGAVYCVYHELLNEKRAIKVLSAEAAKAKDMVQRFAQEAKLASKIRNRHIIKVYDLDKTEDGRPFLIMEYLRGTDLQKTLNELKLRKERASWEFAKPIFLQVCDALQAAHEFEDEGVKSPIIHRDLKPSNIFLINKDGGYFVKLLDFGTAKLQDKLKDKADPVHTRTGLVVGTPIYMAPEQISGRDYDHRADIYAFGCVMYHVICGEPPFKSADTGELMKMHVTMPPLPLGKRRPDISEKVARVVMKCLKKKPSERHASMAEVKKDLMACETGPSSFGPAESGRAPEPRGHPLLRRLLLASALVASASAALFYYARNGLPAVLRWPQPKEAAPVTVQEQVTVEFRVEPGDAAVYDRNGEEVGRKVTLPRNYETLAFTVRKAGYRPKSVEVFTNQNQTIETELIPEGAGGGEKTKNRRELQKQKSQPQKARAKPGESRPEGVSDDPFE